jgi:RimJ/RimL family protein N-acetyltransferase
MFIITQRLFLRPVWQDDAKQIHGLINDWDIVSKLARAPWPYQVQDAEAFAAYAEAAADADTEMTLAICLRPSNQLVGLVGCQKHDSSTWELGYWLGKSWWGHGFATEAARALLAGMFDSRRVPLLTSGYHLDNPASGKVLAKLGFTPGPEVRQLCRAQQREVPVQRLTLTRKAWQARLPGAACAVAA